MKTYLVGGSVRDLLLGIKPKDRDYVVVGSTPEEMISLGYKKVGSDFPVFLHPTTSDEYALARTERKSGNGYKGFETDFNSTITLEMDSSRRDLTMNSIAQDLETGEIIDYFNGREDLKNGILRHVSESFSEDPLRVLRVARFAARYDFKVAPETMQLMKELVSSGEMLHLTPERVWNETEKALGEEYPAIYFKVLKECGALQVLFPEFDDYAVSNLRDMYYTNPLYRYALMFFKIPDAITVSNRLKTPTEYATLANIVSKYSKDFENFYNLNNEECLQFFKNIGFFKSISVFNGFMSVCDMHYIDRTIYTKVYEVAKIIGKIKISDVNVDGLVGKQISDAIDAKRIEFIDILRR